MAKPISTQKRRKKSYELNSQEPLKERGRRTEKKKKRKKEEEEEAVASRHHPYFVIVFFLFSSFFFFWFKFNGKQRIVRSSLIMVLKTVRSDHNSHGSLLFPIERFLRLKEPQKLTVRGFSNRTVRFDLGFKTLVKIKILRRIVDYKILPIFRF